MSFKYFFGLLILILSIFAIFSQEAIAEIIMIEEDTTFAEKIIAEDDILVVEEGVVLTISDKLVNFGIFDNYGTIINGGAITNYGIILNDSNIFNHYIIENHNTITNLCNSFIIGQPVYGSPDRNGC